MLKLTEVETAVVKAFNIKPEDWADYESHPAREFDYAAIATFCMHNGYPEAYDKISAGILLDRIHDKFWPQDGWDGFDSISLDDVAGWVLTTYLDETKVSVMSSEEIVTFLQNWKYYCGFRKAEGNGEFYRQTAFQIFDGTLVLNPNDEEITYIYAEYLVH